MGTNISLRQLEAVVDLTARLGALTDAGRFPDLAVPALAAMLDCDRGTYSEMGPAGITAVDYIHGNRGPEAGAGFLGFDAAVHRLAVTVSALPEAVVEIAVYGRHTGFTETERDMLLVLQGPLSQAYTRSRQHSGTPQPPLEVRCQPLAGLTTAELAVLDRAASGGTNVAIARQLGCSPRTVAKHLEHIYRKLDVADRSAAAVRYATGGGA